MRTLYIGAALTALVTLMIELILTRVFDVVLTPNMAYMVITCAMFAFGLSGVYTALWSVPANLNTRDFLSLLSFLFAASILAILPILNNVPFNIDDIGVTPYLQLFYFGLIYLSLVVPFFLAGLIIVTLFSSYPRNIQSLYFWDLSGAAVGSVIFLPFLPEIGAAGVLFCAAGIAFFMSGLFSRHRAWSLGATAIAGLVIAVPFLYGSGIFEFRLHTRMSLQEARDSGQVAFSRWDPISMIEVFHKGKRRRITYDGGSQSSLIFPFDGDFADLRENFTDRFFSKFWTWPTLVSHYLKRDTDQRVLVIGGGGGQETKAALMFGASHVDVVELVGTVVELVQTKYASFGGDLYHHPKVRAHVGEGRNFLRASDEKYDIIQIYSNHTSSSVAAGTGAMATTYLQTAEAYKEYIGHLTENGVLHINQYYYPRMVTTAALAWKQLGRTDLQRHLVVVEQKGAIPTFLLKAKPWTRAEFEEVEAYLRIPEANGYEYDYRLMENPLDPERSFLSPAFYTADADELKKLEKIVPYRIVPSTDDRPYFKFLREEIGQLEPSAETFVNASTAWALNGQLIRPYIAMDIIHIIVTGVVSLFFVFVCIVVPLRFVNFGEMILNRKLNIILYFSSLGGGFIILELLFIQVFMHFIGSPLYAYSTVLFSMLLAAGLGSMSSRYLGITPEKRWIWPFVGVLACGLALLAVHREVFDIFLGTHLMVRILVSGLLIFPLGFFLGMPFPLGILHLEGQPRGAVAWAWGLNGIFTVVGGLSSVLLSIFLGFRLTLLIALAFYLVAFWTCGQLRRRVVGYQTV